MSYQFFLFYKNHLWKIFSLGASSLITLVAGISFSDFEKIADEANFPSDSSLSIYKTFESNDQVDQGFIANPMYLLDKLKRAGAMNDATTPSDAIDEALKAFDTPDEANVFVE